ARPVPPCCRPGRRRRRRCRSGPSSGGSAGWRGGCAGGAKPLDWPPFLCGFREYLVELACLDLEGVLIPEIWVNFADKTGIDALRATTRDIPDYDVLMRQRLRILDEHGYGLPDIQAVIDTLSPLDGAREFIDWLRERFQVVI